MSYTNHVNGVICCWEFAPGEGKRRRDVQWVLRDCYPIDSDGYSLGTPKVSSDGKHDWEAWLNHRVMRDIDGNVTTDEDKAEYDDPEPIDGRAVTYWNFESGVSLMGLNPPGGMPKWLSISFCEELRKKKNWSLLLEDGHTLYLGTARAAESYFATEIKQVEKAKKANDLEQAEHQKRMEEFRNKAKKEEE